MNQVDQTEAIKKLQRQMLRLTEQVSVLKKARSTPHKLDEAEK
jgi:hypothetical protein